MDEKNRRLKVMTEILAGIKVRTPYNVDELYSFITTRGDFFE